MLKSKPTDKAYMNRDAYIANGKELAEEKRQKAVMRKAVKPNNVKGFH